MEPPPPLERSTCPSIISLGFYGASEYLEAFVARAHMPALTIMKIRFFNQLIFEIPQLYIFTSRVRHRSFHHVEIEYFKDSVYIWFNREGSRGHGLEGCTLKLIIPCRQLDWQLSFTTEIFNQIPNLISDVNLLQIYNFEMPAGREGVDPAQWLELFQPLPSLSEIRVVAEELLLDVVHALVNEDMATGVLPGLTSLHLRGYRKSPSAKHAVERFIAARKLANRNIFLSG
jgi:hypothetical protein